jgi:F-type H+-transporting ATPase subunit b
MHIDGWSLALQAINLLVLLALLRWLFYRPLIGVIDARRKALDDERAAADAARAAAEQQGQQLAEERRALEASRQGVIDGAQRELEKLRAAAAEQSRAEAAAALERAGHRIEQERKAAQQALFEEASALAVSLAGRLLAQSPGTDSSAFVDRLLDRAAAQQPEERARWFADDGARRVTLACATELPAGSRDQARRRLEALLGPDLALAFEVDPALIAGAELRLPHGVLALHWAAELENARTKMLAATEASA